VSRFEGRVALVTGAGGGIGSAVVARLAAEGAAVVCADVDGAAAEATATAHERAVAMQSDVTDPASCRAAVERATQEFGGLDVLVNVAGIGRLRHTEQLELDEWERTLRVNLTGTFLMSREAVGSLLERRGAIVNLASVAALKATPYNAAYCASKAGVVSLTQTMALEFGGRGLRVNCVCPAIVDTAFIDHVDLPEDADLQLLGRGFPVIRRKIRPDEVATAVAYLASDDAAMVTGTAMVLDGGASA
jgi:NAD(P)-dependent dehydrogenase (short-subunit alcohol dehydrogenase family)